MGESSFILEDIELKLLLKRAESILLEQSRRIRFEKCNDWRKNSVPNGPGVYVIFDSDGTMLYVGESGKVKERMSDITRTANHSFRRELGVRRFNGELARKENGKRANKFIDDIEQLLDDYFVNNLYISFLEVNFGRLEIENYLVDKNKETIYNSETKRK